jgi:non-specific serine/threonine protein kinase
MKAREDLPEGATIRSDSLAADHDDPEATLGHDPSATILGDPEPSAAPASIGPYRICRELGQGGMGVVYEAEDARLKRRIAIKVLPPRFSRDTAALARFEREAQLLAAVNHPNIATIHSLEGEGEVTFLTMEYVPGDTLAERIGGAPLPDGDLLTICRQISTALEAAHAKGVVHRDLKPLNVKVTPEGQVKVLDFGLAKALEASTEVRQWDMADSAGGQRGVQGGGAPALADAPSSSGLEPSHTMPGNILGSPGYLSPEQLRGDSIDHRADVWAFGCVLFECLTGRPVFQGKTLAERLRATLAQEIDWAALPAHTPERVRVLLRDCLERDPARRLESITLARQTLEEEIAQRALPSAVSVRARRDRAKPNNLPLQLSSFIGRERELREIARLLGEHRLVTLTGAGGSGKTRLAIEVGWELVGRMNDGVWRVELAPLSDPALVAEAAVTALSLKESKGVSALDTLAEHLGKRETLLVLDNCEHLLDGCANLARALLPSCPKLAILATSHVALGVAEEELFPVPLLSLPEEGALLSPEELWRTESVRLFVERARAVRPDLELSLENAPAIVQICRRLDGIPLALELAAARANVLPVEEIAKRLDDRFRLLTTGAKASLPRHKTLHAMIEWSYENLTPPAQALLSRLSVFAGGWTLDAGEAVCVAKGLEQWEILDALSELVDHALAMMDVEAGHGTDHVRYRMLETVRAYAHQKLEECGALAETQKRHRTFFSGLAAEAESHLTGADQMTWLLRLSADHDNFRAALSALTSPELEELEAAVSMAGALGRYWSVRGHWSEGRRLCAELLAVPAPPSSARAKALHWSGVIAYRQGDYAASRELHGQALAIRRDLGERAGIAASLETLGIVAHDLGEYGESRAFLEESLAIRRELGDRWAIALSLNNIGTALEREGDYERSRTCHEESLALRRELNDAVGVAGSLNNLGCILEWLGELSPARACHEEALELRRALGDPWGVALSLRNLAIVLHRAGELDAARPLLEESIATFRRIEERYEAAQSITALGWVALRQGRTAEALSLQKEALKLRRELGEWRGIAPSLEAIAALAATAEDWTRSAQLFGAAEGLREEMRTPLSTLERAELELELSRVRSALGSEAYDSQARAGRGLPLDRAVGLALGVTG